MSEITIFLAERETHVRRALRLMFDHLDGFTVTGVAGHFAGLLDQVSRRPPDVLLLDWRLTGGHPQEALETLRLHCPGTVMLAVSVKPEDARIAQACGVDGFLSKQASPKHFQAVLESATAPIRKDNA